MIENTDGALLARLERSCVVIGDCVLYHEDAAFGRAWRSARRADRRLLKYPHQPQSQRPAASLALAAPGRGSGKGRTRMGIAISGLAAQIGLQLLSVVYAAWSTAIGRTAIVAVVCAGLAWLAADLLHHRAYHDGAADTRAVQEADRAAAIDGAKSEGAWLLVEAEKAAVAEQAALKKFELLQLKVRDEAKTPDRVLLPADDAWLRSKRH